MHPLTLPEFCATAAYLRILNCAEASSDPVQYWYGRAHRALKQRVSDPAQILKEYQHVCALDCSIGHSTSVAKSKAAAGRNRYINVLPFDYNRCVWRAWVEGHTHPCACSRQQVVQCMGHLPCWDDERMTKGCRGSTHASDISP